ncbi:hypothetical protein JCM10450v2_007075 [Rhodotorula kratochvilovae]
METMIATEDSLYAQSPAHLCILPDFIDVGLSAASGVFDSLVNPELLTMRLDRVLFADKELRAAFMRFADALISLADTDDGTMLPEIAAA